MTTCTAFLGRRRIASGSLAAVAQKAKQRLDSGATETLLIFDDATAYVVEVDFRGSVEDVLARLAPPPEPPKTAGRPKLGVVGREVTLLPRHWEWLNSQPGGASVALRKLVDEARKSNEREDRKRESQTAAYRFMSAMAGNEPGFEEASRALFAGDADQFARETIKWPNGIREYAAQLARAALSPIVV